MKKIWRNNLIGLGIIATIGSAVVAGVSLTPNVKKNNTFIFDNRIFNNVDEAIRYLIQKEKIQIDDLQVLGDLSRSFSNAELGLLNKTLLPDFDPSNINFAYFMAGGGLTDNYDEAKASYFNPGSYELLYDDGFGNRFNSELQAKRSMENNKIEQNIAFYEVPFINGQNSYQMTKINPFNSDDIKKYQKNLQDHSMDLLINAIEGESTEKNNDKDSNNYYQIEFVNDNTKEQENYFDLANFLHNYNNNIKFDGSNFYWKDDYKTEVAWTSDNVDFGGGWDFQNSKTWHAKSGPEKDAADFRMYVDTSSNNKTYGSGTHNSANDYGHHWFTWEDDDKIEDASEKEIINILNMNNANFLKWSSSKPKINNLENGEYEFKNALKEVKNNFSLEFFQKYINNNRNNTSIFLKNNKFNDYYYNLISHLLVNNIDSLIDAPFDSKYDLSGEDLPNVEGMISENTYYAFVGWKQTIKIDGTFLGKASYEAKTKIDKKNSEKINLNKNSKILNNLIAWTDPFASKKIKIKYDNHSLFEATLAMAPVNNFKEWKPKITDIKIASDNQQDENNQNILAKNGNDDSANNHLILEYLKEFVFKIQEALKIEYEDDQVQKIEEIFNYYFDDKCLEEQLGDYKYNINLEAENSIKMEQKIKLFFTNLKNTYDKYKNNGYLLKSLAKTIPLPEDIFIFPVEEEEEKEGNLSIAKYRLTSIVYFNPQLSEGLFANPSTIATNQADWEILKNKDNGETPAQILIYYDNNGKPLNIGDYLYDQKVIIEYNASNYLEPRHDYNHVYVEGYLEPILNQTSLIHRLIFEKERYYYFDTFSHLKDYLEQYIIQNLIIW